MPPQQLVLGVPAYARSYTLRSSSNSFLGAPVTGPGQPGPYTKVSGFLSYQEVGRIRLLPYVYTLNVVHKVF